MDENNMMEPSFLSAVSGHPIICGVHIYIHDIQKCDMQMQSWDSGVWVHPLPSGIGCRSRAGAARK